MKQLFFIVLIFPLITFSQKIIYTDVLVIGGGTGGVAAGIQSARMGNPTLIVEQTPWLGGMLSSAGVSCTDGNHLLQSGLWQEFRNELYKHYKTQNLNTGWVSNTCFEPKVADSIFKQFALKEKKLSVEFNWFFNKTIVIEKQVLGAEFINKNKQTLVVNAKITIDATELGDAMASAGVKYYVGTDDPKLTGEKEAAYASDIIQDLTFAATLQDLGKEKNQQISKPIQYNASNYYCSNTQVPCNDKSWNGDALKMLNYGKLPNKKYMVNWPAHGNDYYINVIEAKPIERERLLQDAKNYTLGFIYFMQTEMGFKHLGLSDDFPTEDKLPFIPYYREGRRMKGKVQLNVNHLKNPLQFSLYKTGISVGDYPVDHHHAMYKGKVPPIQFPSIPSYNIPLGSLIPDSMQGIIVCDKSISVTNIVNGTTRLQPVVLLTGQAAGILANQLVKNSNSDIINVRSIQSELLKNKAYIMPIVDVDVHDEAWKSIQKITATGILKTVGVSEAWANKSYFNPDIFISITALLDGLKEVYPAIQFDKFQEDDDMALVSQHSLFKIMKNILENDTHYSKEEVLSFENNFKKIIQEKLNTDFDLDKGLTKKQIAILMDECLNPFEKININLYGELVN